MKMSWFYSCGLFSQVKGVAVLPKANHKAFPETNDTHNGKSKLSRHFLKLYSAKNQCIRKYLPYLLDSVIFSDFRESDKENR